MIYKLFKYVNGEWYWWCDYTDPVWLAQAANELGRLGLEIKIEVEKDEPLTVNELKNMAGAPVWISLDTGRGYWALVGESLDNLLAFVTIPRDTIFVPDGCYGETWLAYRHPPKESPNV